MSVKSELHCINVELAQIKESRERIESYIDELNKHNPFNVGDVLIGGDFTHRGKEFLVDKIFVYYNRRAGNLPRLFVAEGFIKLKSGKTGINRTTCSIEITQK